MGDPVTSIGGCQVTSIRDWNGCLAKSMREPSCGNCVPVNMITELDTARKAKIGMLTGFNIKIAIQPKLARNYEFSARKFSKIFC